MRRVLAAAILGALAGLSAAAAVLIAASPLLYYTTVVTVPSPADILWYTAKGWGPGHLVLGLVLSLYLRRRAAQGASRGRLLALGLFSGLPLGLLHLLAMVAWTDPNWTLSDLPASVSIYQLIFVAASLAGGAGVGLGCAWWMSRPPKETA